MANNDFKILFDFDSFPSYPFRVAKEQVKVAKLIGGICSGIFFKPLLPPGKFLKKLQGPSIP